MFQIEFAISKLRITEYVDTIKCVVGKLDSLESSLVSSSDSGLDGMDSGPAPNSLANGTLPVSEAVAKQLINPEVKSWKFLEEEAPLLDFINVGAVNDKTELLIDTDVKVSVSLYTVI